MTDILPFHPYADLFPLMEGDDLDRLVTDIEQNGLQQPIVLHDGAILDGRNRFRACLEAQVPIVTETFAGKDPLAFVVSANLHRRHLSVSQRAMIAAKLANMTVGNPSFANSANLQNSVSQTEAANRLDVSPRSVATARGIRDQGTPELAKLVEADKVSVSAAAEVASLPVAEQQELVARGTAEILAAAKAIRLERAEVRRTENAALKAATVDQPVAGRYGTIVIDPPWDMEKIERDMRPNQVGFDYPTMTEAELAAFAVADMAADNCHLFCWTTQKFLQPALRLVADWGFRYVLAMVWHKPGGFQPYGLPQYNCEFVIYARRGAPRFVDTKAFPTCFGGARREHSRKPDEFYDLIRRVTGDSRIDVFSREVRDGFDQYGNEAGKFEAVGDVV